MSAANWIGIIMIASMFCGLFAACWRDIGLKSASAIFGGVVGAFCFIFLAVWLIKA